MRTVRLVWPFVAILTISLSAQTVPTGTWKAVFVGPIGPRPIAVDAVNFSIRDTGTGFIGTAAAGSWPGDLDVSDVKFDGDTLTFTGTGKSGSSTVSGGVRTDHCCPKLLFKGTIQGDEMTLTMTWTSTDAQPGDPTRPPLPMKATRTSR